MITSLSYSSSEFVINLMILTWSFVAWINWGYNLMIYPPHASLRTHTDAKHGCKKKRKKNALCFISITRVNIQLLVDPAFDINVHVSGSTTRWRPRLVAILTSGFIITKSLFNIEME